MIVLSLVHNIGLIIKTTSKAPLDTGTDTGIEISAIPAMLHDADEQLL